jgi:hypothetical protein
MHHELSQLAQASTEPSAGISREQYLAMQQRIAVLTAELKRYKYQNAQDSNSVDTGETRRHQRHDKGQKHNF